MILPLSHFPNWRQRESVHLAWVKYSLLAHLPVAVLMTGVNLGTWYWQVFLLRWDVRGGNAESLSQVAFRGLGKV